jgi:hypothetical protein
MDHKTPHGLHPLCLHETGGSILYLAHDEMEKYESLHQQEFGHTRVYNVNLLERVGMDEEPPLILQTIGWGELYGGDRTTRVMDG